MMTVYENNLNFYSKYFFLNFFRFAMSRHCAQSTDHSLWSACSSVGWLWPFTLTHQSCMKRLSWKPEANFYKDAQSGQRIDAQKYPQTR